jgi:DNA-binding beta-propeller fold protein YncE
MLVVGLFAAAMLCGQATPSPALLALSKADRTLAIVDPATNKVMARMPSGPDPHEVVASADGRFAYISNYGGGSYNTITVVDLTAQKTLMAIDLGALRGPHGLDFAGGKVWFTAEVAKAIGSIDPATNKVDWILGTGQDRTHMLYVLPDLQRIVTSNVNAATMSLIEKTVAAGRGPGGPPQPDWHETVVGVGRGAEGFDISPDRKEIWAANAQDGTISILDFAAKKVIQTLNADVSGANRLKFTIDGKLAFVSTLSGPELTVIDAASRKTVKRINTGHGAAGILMRPDGEVAYVGCTPDDYVAIVNLKSMTVAGHIDVGRQPDGLAWAVRQP